MTGDSRKRPGALPRGSFCYGPVPSRRLGLSLGLSIVPAKTCTIDCVYCQCGRTTRKTLKRERFYPVEEILAQVRQAVKNRRMDFLTFSGEGEPTLNRDIGTIIRRLKQEHKIPVAVITNSTLLTDPEVRRDLYQADLVVPSLDAADPRTFARVNRGHTDLDVEDIIESLVRFRRYYKGQMWLEVLLVRDLNDSVEHLMRVRRAAHRIRPDRVHLNTVVRPPAEKTALPLSEDDLEQVLHLFGPTAEIAGSPPARVQRRLRGNHLQTVLDFIRRRPATRQDLEHSLGLTPSLTRSVLTRLIRSGQVKRVKFWGKEFYERDEGTEG